MDARPYSAEDKLDSQIGPISISNHARNGLTSQQPAVHATELMDYVLLIDPRALERECLSRSLSVCSPQSQTIPVASIDEWRKRGMQTEPAVILLVVGGKKIADPDVGEEIGRLAEEFPFSPVVIVADSDDLCQILKALEAGAKGYIPSSVGIDIAAEVIGLARAGGIFVPASSVLTMRDVIQAAGNAAASGNSLFTPREAEVAEALRRGKANKIIAYELDLCESTVKVHIRNIMKKLNATNRTEVAYKIRNSLG